MEELPTVPDFLENYHYPLKIVLSAILLFGSGLLLARTLEYKKRPPLSYQEAAEVAGSQTTVVPEQTMQSEVRTELVVDVSGAVKEPGVYSLDSGARVKDALDKAGGLADTADKTWVSRELNLAAKLSDGTKIYIPIQGEAEVTAEFKSAVSGSETSPGESSDDAGCPAKININTAPLETLTCLYNVGEARAQAIVDYRSNNPFDSVEEITNIKGIGEKTLERIRERVVVN